MAIDCDRFRVEEGKKIDLGEWPTRVKPVYKSRKHYEEMLAEHVARLDEQQQLLYA